MGGKNQHVVPHGKEWAIKGQEIAGAPLLLAHSQRLLK